MVTARANWAARLVRVSEDTTRAAAVPEPQGSASVKEIGTLPPVETFIERLDLSERTGEPTRRWPVVASVVLGYLSGVASAGMYARSWWLAAHPDTFTASARLLGWVDPPPGKWLALLLVTLLAAVFAIMVAAPAIVSYNAWFGHRWTRVGGLVATAITAAGTVLFLDWGWIGVGLAGLSAALLWVPEATRYFEVWRRLRCPIARPRGADQPVVYGPLPRYRWDG